MASLQAKCTERLHTEEQDGLKLVDALREHIPVLMEKHQTPGLSIALADKGCLIWEAGFGLSDIARGEPMTPDTVFRSGSLAKAYTATAAMILVDRGVLALDDLINRFLPFEVHNPLGGREIVIQDLMIHTSGLGADTASSWAPSDSLAHELAREYTRDWSRMYGGNRIPRWTYPVGTAWTYSNLGIATLGLIVETSNPERLCFSEFVQRHIIDPLGMTHSCLPPAQTPDCVPPDLWAKIGCGYSRMGSADIPSLPVHLGEYPAGGALACSADHVRFLRLMMNGGELNGHRILNERTTAQMLAPAVDLKSLSNARDVSLEGQGLVWRLKDLDQPWTSFEHGGAHMFCWRTQGRAWPRYRAAVTVAANQWSLPDDTKEVDEIADFIGTWLRYRQSTSGVLRDAVKLSYARGALLAAAYKTVFGVTGDIPAGALDRAVSDTRDRGGDWNAAAFRRGFNAINTLSGGLEAIQQFWTSSVSEVDADTWRAAYAVLGGTSQAGYLWSLLPTANSCPRSSDRSISV
jgi:CubicO group peptidase (beta-lactamase class C family)